MMHKHSDYMHWAKTQSRARYNLATSGVGAFPLRDLPEIPLLEINGDNSYGYAPLKAAIAERHGVDPDSVVTAAGTSMANYLAFAALLEPGDEVLIEQPDLRPAAGCALLRRRPGCVRSRARSRTAGRLTRRWCAARLPPHQADRAHQPAQPFQRARPPNRCCARSAKSPAKAGARVLVDEVYLDAVYENTPRTSFHLGPQFVVTSSLTKVYGVSGLRCGWILAEPALARAMWRLNDLFAATPVHPGELLSVAVLRNLATCARALSRHRGSRPPRARRVPRPASTASPRCARIGAPRPS